jgi:hypothetical protein
LLFCGFNLHFPVHERCWAPFEFLLLNVFIYFLCPLLIWLFVILALSSISSLDMPSINLLSDAVGKYFHYLYCIPQGLWPCYNKSNRLAFRVLPWRMLYLFIYLFIYLFMFFWKTSFCWQQSQKVTDTLKWETGKVLLSPFYRLVAILLSQSKFHTWRREATIGLQLSQWSPGEKNMKTHVKPSMC